jgi:hypothetical protein
MTADWGRPQGKEPIMTGSEFAFLAIGLVLGLASGAALVYVLRSRPPNPEIRLTVGHDAVPRRAATLSSDPFSTSPVEPARGGPADRRSVDRTPPPAVAPPQPSGPPESPLRTPVPYRRPAPAVAGIPIVPERDPALDALRIQATLAAERLNRTGQPTAASLLGARPGPADDPTTPISAAAPVMGAPAAPVVGTRSPAAAPAVPDSSPVAAAAAPLAPAPSAVGSGSSASAVGPAMSGAVGPGPAAPAITTVDRRTEAQEDARVSEPSALERILRGDRQALLATVVTLAGADAAQRRPWQHALLALQTSLVERAIAAGYLVFPAGHGFWDGFRPEQRRAIAASLAATGHRFDGVDGWAQGRAPDYRDITLAVASAGVEPRRIRAWPTREEIERVYVGADVATLEFLLDRAPTLDRVEVQAVVGTVGPDWALMWADWDRVSATLQAPITGA